MRALGRRVLGAIAIAIALSPAAGGMPCPAAAPCPDASDLARGLARAASRQPLAILEPPPGVRWRAGPPGRIVALSGVGTSQSSGRAVLTVRPAA